MRWLPRTKSAFGDCNTRTRPKAMTGNGLVQNLLNLPGMLLLVFGGGRVGVVVGGAGTLVGAGSWVGAGC